MGSWVFILLATCFVSTSAHHNAFHQPAALSLQTEPQHQVAYAVPIQVIPAQHVQPAGELYPTVYTAPGPQVYTAAVAPQAQVYTAAVAPQPQVYTAAVAPQPQVYTAAVAPQAQVYTATVTPTPQVYAVTPAPSYDTVHSLGGHSYSAVSYSAPSASQSYSAQTYAAPSYPSAISSSYPTPGYSTKTYVASHPSNAYSSSSYTALRTSQIVKATSYPAKLSSLPSFSSKSAQSSPSYSAKISVPSHSSHGYSAVKYSLPATSITSQYMSPSKSFTKTSYSSPSSVNSFSAPKVSHSQFTPSLTQYSPAINYRTSDANQYSTSNSYVKPVAILRQSQDDSFDGTFSYDFQAENGIASSATGRVKQLNPKEVAQQMQGEYSYTAPDGTPVVTRWYADETGFHAEGSHLPVAPPVPEAIAKSLAYQGVQY